MAEWGDDEPEIEAEPFDVDDAPQGPRERREPGHAFGVDIGELTAELVTATFQKAIRKQVTAVISGSSNRPSSKRSTGTPSRIFNCERRPRQPMRWPSSSPPSTSPNCRSPSPSCTTAPSTSSCVST